MMAQVVCIAAGTVRDKICAIGDIVAIHDDDVQLIGPGYTHFDVLQIGGMRASELREEFQKITPIPEPEGDEPKYALSAAGWSEADKTALASELTSSAERLEIIARTQVNT